ncbi:MAG: 4'-phosphopantetheinyl transferase superfamily protein [Verrucomicrobia bacterium]|nr:4'-phosphopantetheinyl transferase superfamily protein [Verrucomicrobiota bacterium]
MKTSSGHISIADWAVAPQELTLAKGEVHVWRAFIDQFAAFTDEFAMALNDEEQDAARRFRFERDRNSYTITRALLRKILSRYLACDPGRLIFDYSERGKPSVSGMPLHFNVSHSRGVALFAITRDCEVGVDLEQVRAMDDLLDIARNFFSTHEQSMLASLPKERQTEAFFNCWTRKEAYVKATGAGITEALDRFAVTLAPGEAARFVNVSDDPEITARWRLSSFVPAAGFIGALAWQGPPLAQRFWDCGG